MRVISITSLCLLLCFLQSCLSVPLSRNRSNVNSSTTFEASTFEPLKRDEYTLLNNLSGTASTRQMYFLFFPIGHVKSDKELEQNAYFDALSENSSADAIILPRVKTTKFFIPLLIVNFYSKKVTLTGRSIKLNAASDAETGKIGTSNKK